MDVNTVKTSAGDSTIGVMAMMMQMEKFPEISEPFNYNSSTDYQQNEFLGGMSSICPNVTPPPTLMDPITPSSSSVNLVNNHIQQPNEVVPMRNANPSLLYPTMSSSEKKSSMAAMREMIFRIAVMQPIHIDPESIKPPKRRNVKVSKDPQSVAARHRRERISERIRILQRLVPGGTKMDTASMLDEAIHYMKFLKKQVQTLEQVGASRNIGVNVVGFPGMSNNANVNYSPALLKGCQPNYQMVGSTSKQMLS